MWHLRLFNGVGKGRPSMVKHDVLVRELAGFLSGLQEGQIPTILDAFSGAGTYGDTHAAAPAAPAPATPLAASTSPAPTPAKVPIILTTTTLTTVSSAASYEEARGLFLSIPANDLGSPLLCLQQALRANRAVNLVFVEQSPANYATLLDVRI